MSKIKTIVQQISLKQQLAEMLMLDLRYFGLDKNQQPLALTQLPKELEQFLKEYSLGGIALFRENFTNLEQTVALTSAIQKDSDYGRLIGVDQEGGVVTRINFATNLSGNMALGAINDPKTSHEAAKIIGEELNILGVNLNFAPSVDVNINPLNPIIGVRSFGSDPQHVAIHGSAYVSGLHEAQVLACAKHFPGHGDTSGDTHLTTTYVNHSLEELEKVDLFPFQSLINDRVDTIMTAHVVVPALDNGKLYSSLSKKEVDTPATLSKKIMTELLRNKMKFEGLILTDAMDMRAISSNFTAVESSVMAILAGVDMLVMPVRVWDIDGIANFKVYFDELYQQCLKQPELMARVQESSDRIIKLKLAKVKPQLDNLKNKDFANRCSQAKSLVASAAHQKFEQQIATQAVTLQQNSAKHLPFNWKTNDRLLIISNKPVLAELAQTIVTRQGTLKAAAIKQLTLDYSLISKTHLSEQLTNFDKVIILSYNLNEKEQEINNLFRVLNQLNLPYVLICCRNPYDVLIATESTTSILIYGVSGFDQTNYQQQHFALNLNAALEKIASNDNVEDYNHYIPVLL